MGPPTPLAEPCFTHRWKVSIYLGLTLLKSFRILVLTQSSADPRCPGPTHAPRAKLVSEEGRLDVPAGHPRPGYRRRSIPGPTAVERRHWFGLDRFIGRGTRSAGAAPSFRRGRNAHHRTTRSGSSPPRIGATRCGGDIQGPQTVDRRRWFGPGRHIGRDYDRTRRPS